MNRRNSLFAALAALASISGAGCVPPNGGPGTEGAANATVGSQQFALNDDGGQLQNPPPQNNVDPFAAGDPVPAVAARMHSCQKIPYETLRNLLVSRGADVSLMSATTYGKVWNDKNNAATLGVPNFGTRQREVTRQSTSGATKLLDVLIAAAPDIISKMSSMAACKGNNGQGATMFSNGGTQCTFEGIGCLQGYPATVAQVNLCNEMLKDIPGATGQNLAVATILATAHACE